jgi:hypothetical protein
MIDTGFTVTNNICLIEKDFKFKSRWVDRYNAFKNKSWLTGRHKSNKHKNQPNYKYNSCHYLVPGN